MTDLRNAQLTDLLPKSVAEQQWVQSVSDAWHDLTLLILDFADNAKVYTGIDQASDELLDILATQFRAPRYRQDYDIETKRRLVKASLPYYMTVGTKAAVEDVMRDLYGDATVREWFEYDGTPGCFRIKIKAEGPIDIEEMLDICDYWFSECYRREIPLGPFTRISFATNGRLWFSPAAQHLLEKYHDLMSVTVSIDGVQELHDRYRIDEDGNGSFSTAWAAFQDGKRKYGWLNSKMTFVPGSIQYIASSMKMMLDAGCRHIAGNCAYEPMYTDEDGKALYKQLKEVSQYVIKNGWDVAIAMLDEQIGDAEQNDRNFCGGTGSMLSFAPDGSAYPCIRYAPISIGKEKADRVCLGNVQEGGLYATDQQRQVKEELDAITMKSQSTEECIHCPVSSGCGWCSGLNYEMFGTANRRYTGICKVHKARVLAVCWYCNMRSIALGDTAPKKVNLPYKEVARLIGEDEAAELKAIEKEAAEKWAW